MEEEISEVDWFTPDRTHSKIAKAGQLLDEILDIAKEPIPESWIDKVENLEQAMARGNWTQRTIIGNSITNPSKPGLSEKRSHLRLLRKKSIEEQDLNPVSQEKQIDLAVTVESSRIEDFTGRQEAMENEMFKRDGSRPEVQAEAEHSLQYDSQVKSRLTSNEEEYFIWELRRNELRDQLQEQHKRLSQPRAIRPASIASMEESSNNDSVAESTDMSSSFTNYSDSQPSTSATPGGESMTPISMPLSEPQRPFSTAKALDEASKTFKDDSAVPTQRRATISDYSSLQSHFGDKPRQRPSLPMGTLEATEFGLLLDMERVAAFAAERMSPSPPGVDRNSMSRSPSVRAPIDRFLESAAAANAADADQKHDETIIPSPEIDLSTVDDESPTQTRQRKERELKILEKDRFKGRNILPTHTPGSSVGSVDLGSDAPTRVSVDVASLRSNLSTSSGTPEKPDKQVFEKETLDKKIQTITSQLQGEHIELRPADSPEKDKMAQFGSYKLVSTTSASTLKEAGYGTTRKYVLQRPNAPPQIIWVRIIAERVMVRVGGGWTDLAEWLSNYILYHTATGSAANSSNRQSSPQSTPSSGRRNSEKVQSRVSSWGRQMSNKATSRPGSTTNTPTPAMPSTNENLRPNSQASSSLSLKSKASVSSLKKKKAKGSENSSSANSSTNSTPISSLSGPVSSHDKGGKLSNEKKAWVQKMLQQVNVGLSSSPSPATLDVADDEVGGNVKRRLFSS